MSKDLKYKILKEYEKLLMKAEDILGNGSTTNMQLEILGKFLFKEKFLGVYSANTFPHMLNNEMLIINTDPSTKSGTHWISVFKYKNKYYCYDTFNRDIKTLFSPYLKNKKNIVNANIDRDESFSEDNCGQRAICWLILANKYGPNIIMNII